MARRACSWSTTTALAALVLGSAFGAGASSSPVGWVVEGSVRLEASGPQVALASAEQERAWLAEEERRIAEALAVHLPSLRALLDAAAQLEGVEPIAWRPSLERCDRREASAPEAPCRLVHDFESQHMPASSRTVTLEIAFARAPPEAARAAIWRALPAVAAGEAVTRLELETVIAPPFALPRGLTEPWPWLALSVVALVMVLVVRWRREKRGARS